MIWRVVQRVAAVELSSDAFLIQHPCGLEHNHSLSAADLGVKKRANSVFSVAFTQRLDGMLSMGAKPSHIHDALLVTEDEGLKALIPANLSLLELQTYKSNKMRGWFRR